MNTTEKNVSLDEGTFERIFEYAVEGIFQTLPDGRYLRVNPALARIYAYETPEELLSNLTDIADQLYVDSERRDEFMKLIEESDSVTDFVSEIRCKDGSTRWITENARAVRDISGELKYYEGFVVDITEKIEAEKREKNLEKEMQQVQNLTALGILAGGVSHDVKTLLNIIGGHADMAMENSDEFSVARHLKDISGVVQQGLDMVERIDGFNQDASEIKEAVQVDVLVKDVIRMLGNVVAPSVEIRQHIELDIGTVMASPNQIFNVVMNLCTNAFRALGENGGVLHVGLRMIEADGTYPPGLQPGKYIGLSVSDGRVDGDGSESLNGFGLGIVKSIVQGLNGDIGVRTDAEKGTTFDLYLPVHKEVEEGEDILSRMSGRFQDTLMAAANRT